jgi:hypothetical protein
MTEIRELTAHLENGGQADPNGLMVVVSRHAVTEAVRLLRLLGETEDALAACQSQASGLLRAIRDDIEAAYNGLDYLTSLHVAAAADPNNGRKLAIDAAEIKGRLLLHMKRIDDLVVTTSTASDGVQK